MIVDPLVELHSSSSRFNKNLGKILKALNRWDMKDLEKLVATCEEDYSSITRQWASAEERINKSMEELDNHIHSLEFGLEVETALKEASIPIQGVFPSFEFPPFKLVIEPDQREVRLSIGRKTIKINSMQPREMAAQIQKHYQMVTSRKLDSKRFLQDLLPAYEIANRLTYGEESVLWGRAVPLNRIYELFTMRKASRQEYPKELFQYDIGRMKEQFGLALDQYRFELGFSRDQSKAMIIVDNQGRTHHISSLTIYRGESR